MYISGFKPWRPFWVAILRFPVDVLYVPLFFRTFPGNTLVNFQEARLSGPKNPFGADVGCISGPWTSWILISSQPSLGLAKPEIWGHQAEAIRTFFFSQNFNPKKILPSHRGAENRNTNQPPRCETAGVGNPVENPAVFCSAPITRNVWLVMGPLVSCAPARGMGWEVSRCLGEEILVLNIRPWESKIPLPKLSPPTKK